MRIDNFILVERKGKSASNYTYHGTVDIETGHLWWKKKETKKIFRKFIGDWYFVDTGETTPGFIVENLARSWTARTGENT